MKILGKEDWLTRGQSLAEHGDHGAVQYPYGPVVDSVRTALGRASLAVRVVRANNRARQRHQATLWKRSIRHGTSARGIAGSTRRLRRRPTQNCPGWHEYFGTSTLFVTGATGLKENGPRGRHVADGHDLNGCSNAASLLFDQGVVIVHSPYATDAKHIACISEASIVAPQWNAMDDERIHECGLQYSTNFKNARTHQRP